MDQSDYFENEVRQIIVMLRDHRHDGYIKDGMVKKLKRIRDLIDKELKDYES